MTMILSMIKQFYKNRYTTHFIIFVSTAFLSAILNTLLIRNLAGDQLSIWIAAATVTGIISVSYTGITLKNLGELINKTSNAVSLKHRSNSIFKKNKNINKLFYFVLGLIVLINQFLFYCIVMSILLYYNSKVLAISQFYKKQSSVIFGTFIYYLLFISSITIYKNFFGLSFFEVGSLHIISYSLYILIVLKLIPIKPNVSFKNLSTRFNLTFAFFITFGQLDIFIANLNLGIGDRGTYSGSASYSRFGFAIFSFIAFYALEKLARKELYLSVTFFKLIFSGYSLIILVGTSVYFINSNLAVLIFGSNFEDLFKILGLQIISYSPWFLLYLPIQYLIVNGNKKLSLILVKVFFLEIFLGFIFATSVNRILFLHFIFGNMVLLLVLRLFRQKKMKTPKYYFYLGTSAEIIKVKKLIQLFQGSTVINTFQHTVSYFDVLKSLNSYKTKEHFVFHKNANSLRSFYTLPFWITERLIYSIIYFARIKIGAARNKQEVFIFIHGDTISSFLGGVLGYLFGFQVAHIEAGLRSHNILNPFPEELIRRVNSLMSSYHFAPDEIALSNLNKYEGLKFNSKGNTFIDSLDPEVIRKPVETQDPKYIVVHLHRLEFLRNNGLVLKTVETLISLGSKFLIYIIIDSQSHKIRKFVNPQNFSDKLKLVDKYEDRNEFLGVCLKSEFVITDSGGLQEELAILGVPTVIHRKFTEREDGLGRNAVLTSHECDVILKFSLNYEKYRFEENYFNLGPSQYIYDTFVSSTSIK